MVARLGGDEFCLLLQGQTRARASMIVHRIRRKFSQREFVGKGNGFSATASFGYREFQRGMTLQEWLAKADEALYRAKREGRDRVYLQPRIHYQCVLSELSRAAI